MASRLSDDERQRRDNEIIRLRSLMPGWTWVQIAETVSKVKPTWKITERQCREIRRLHTIEKSKELVEMAGGGPATTAYVQSVIDDFQQLRQLAAQVAQEATGGISYRKDPATGEDDRIVAEPNHSATLGAISRILEIRRVELDLLQGAGLLPKNLGVVRVDLEIRQLVTVVGKVLDKYVAKSKRYAVARELELVLTERATMAGTPVPAQD